MSSSPTTDPEVGAPTSADQPTVDQSPAEPGAAVGDEAEAVPEPAPVETADPSSGTADAHADTPPVAGGGDDEQVRRLEREGDIAADYLEELLDIADLDGDIDLDVEGTRAAASIVGADLSQLVGSNGEVLEALQELTRLAVLRETGERSGLMLDVSGYRAAQRRKLEKLAHLAVADVQESGAPVSLDAMTPFERKVVHDVVAAAGLTSQSEGAEPRRYVVILPG